jgi:hypothetical protein
MTLICAIKTTYRRAERLVRHWQELEPRATHPATTGWTERGPAPRATRPGSVAHGRDPGRYGVEGPCCSLRPAGTVVTAIAALGAVSAVLRLRRTWNTQAGDGVRRLCLPTSPLGGRSRPPSSTLHLLEYGERMVLTRFCNCG